MGEKIYGVDLSEKITPVMVRDAIIECFYQAHKDEILKRMDIPEKEKDKFTRGAIKSIVEKKFEEAKADFNNPTKKDLINVCAID